MHESTGRHRAAPSAPQFVERAPVWGVEPCAMLLLCLTPPVRVVPIVQHGGYNCVTGVICLDNLYHFLQKYKAVPILRQNGYISHFRWFFHSDLLYL